MRLQVLKDRPIIVEEGVMDNDARGRGLARKYKIPLHYCASVNRNRTYCGIEAPRKQLTDKKFKLLALWVTFASGYRRGN